MPRTGRPKKQYQNLKDELFAAKIADRRAVLVARNKIKKTVEWINANEATQKIMLDRVRNEVLLKREDNNISGKYYK